MSRGYVYLCGAGCGEADLITVRGKTALSVCDTVIYDSLIDERLLELAPENAERICVGKRAGHHSEKQENINEIIAKQALSGKCVVRLKGGDPLIFGRGGEEAEHLRKMGISYEFIPGITSSSAVPELAGIPVTHRRVSRSFHVITGHTADTLLPENMAEYAALKGTLVFLMGLKNLPYIAQGLTENGRSADTPAAVISNGGRKSQAVYRGTLANITEKAKNAPSPAVIVIGDTACFDLLSKKRTSVSLVGTEGFTHGLSQRLFRHGISCDIPCELVIKEYDNNPAFDAAVKNIGKYSAAAFCSSNGVRLFFEKLRKARIDIRRLSHMKFAAIGSGTAAALEKYGIFADIIPEKYTSEALGSCLARCIPKGEKILIPRAEKGSDELTKPLDLVGVEYDQIRLYDVYTRGDNAFEITSDFIVFGSSSGVRYFREGGYTISDSTAVICIGNVTADTFVGYFNKTPIIPETQDSKGIIKEILRRTEQ